MFLLKKKDFGFIHNFELEGEQITTRTSNFSSSFGKNEIKSNFSLR